MFFGSKMYKNFDYMQKLRKKPAHSSDHYIDNKQKPQIMSGTSTKDNLMLKAARKILSNTIQWEFENQRLLFYFYSVSNIYQFI